MLKMALRRESERIEVSPDLRRRLNARMGRGSRVRARALAVSIAVALAAVGVAVWFFAGREPVKESLIGTPEPGATDSYFEGYWPVHTRAEAEAMQARVDRGEEPWRREPEKVAQAYARDELGWDLAPQTGFTDPRAGDTTVDVPIAPMIGEAPQQQRGSDHLVRLVALAGAERPVWFVGGVTGPSITVDAPTSGSEIRSPVHVSGNGIAFEGNILVTVVDDAGRKVGQTNVTAGGSERMPFQGDVMLREAPQATAGIVQFEGGSGLGGPSTDVAIVRVRFAGPTSTAVSPSPQQGDVGADDYAADDAFRCFFSARHYRDLDMAKPCMTKRYRDSITDPLEFIGPSSPNVERATIVSSSRDGNRVVYDALVYWGSSTGLDFVSEDVVSVVFEGDGALVDSWTQGPQMPAGQAVAFNVWFLAPGDTPRCSGGAPTSQSFVPIERVLPEEAVVEDQALSLARELVTGHYAHEADGDSVFANGTRVERVTVTDRVAMVELNVGPSTEGTCDFATEAMRRTLTGLEGVDDVEITQAPSRGAPAVPDV